MRNQKITSESMKSVKMYGRVEMRNLAKSNITIEIINENANNAVVYKKDYIFIDKSTT